MIRVAVEDKASLLETAKTRLSMAISGGNLGRGLTQSSLSAFSGTTVVAGDAEAIVSKHQDPCAAVVCAGAAPACHDGARGECLAGHCWYPLQDDLTACGLRLPGGSIIPGGSCFAGSCEDTRESINCTMGPWSPWEPSSVRKIQRARSIVKDAEGPKGSCGATVESASCGVVVDPACDVWTTIPQPPGTSGALSGANDTILSNTEPPGAFVWEWWIFAAIGGAGAALIVLVVVIVIVVRRRRRLRKVRMSSMTPAGSRIDSSLMNSSEAAGMRSSKSFGSWKKTKGDGQAAPGDVASAGGHSAVAERLAEPVVVPLRPKKAAANQRGGENGGAAEDSYITLEAGKYVAGAPRFLQETDSR